MDPLMASPPVLSDWLTLADPILLPFYTAALMLLWLSGHLAQAYDQRTQP